MTRPWLLGLLALATLGCRATCHEPQKLRLRFDIPSCCPSYHYYWSDAAKDCVALTYPNCGCVCQGPDCKRVFPTQQECREKYSHCRE